MWKLTKRSASGVCLFWLLSGSVATGYEVITVQNGGAITGVVTYTGDIPTPEKIEISKDQEVCGQTEKTTETLVVGENRGLRNVVVSITNISRGKAFEETAAILDQKDCRYAPHVVLTPLAKPLTILNSDGILHSVRTHSSQNPAFHKAQSKFKKAMVETFGQPEVIQVSCDVHSWMTGWIIVQDHPYFAVTDEHGQFVLSDVPVGDYQLRFWHETLGLKYQSVVVQRDQEARFRLSFP
jgi:hypothetical protein